MSKKKRGPGSKIAFFGVILICLLILLGIIKFFIQGDVLNKPIFADKGIDSAQGTDPAGEEPINNNPVSQLPDEPDQPAQSALDDWHLILVNPENLVPADYTIETRALSNGLQFDARAYDGLVAMLADGSKEGLSFIVCSAYRSLAKQTELFENKVKQWQAQGLSYEEAYDVAKTIVAVPGTSEHQLGLAADIIASDYQILDEGYENTAEAKWLKEHAHEYGFILRYPKDKESITKIIYEPWHFRYVGKEHAAEIKRLEMCLEEYLDYLKSKI